MSRSCEPNESVEARQLNLIDAALRQVESACSTAGAGRMHADGTTHPRPSVSSAWEGIRQLKGYRLESEVLRGGQGVVYRATQESTGKAVAIKVVSGGRFAGPQQMARFEREVRILALIQHPSIVTIHDSGMVDGVPYFVMDFIEGKRLDHYVHSHRLVAKDRLELFADICSAVHAAHLHGVIHRDLKPGNILVDDQGKPHVLDFGLAKPIGDSEDDQQSMTETGQFVGSLPWASPEQVASHDRGIDLRTDVYSLGVILYQLLTDALPYAVNGPTSDVIQRIVHEEPKNPQSINRHLDTDLATIALKALNKDRDRRYQGAGALADDVRRYLNGEPIDAKRSSLLYLVRKRLARHKVLTALAVMTALSIVVGLVVSVTFWRLANQRAESALRNARRAETVQKFLAEAMASANVLESGQADISVREMIDESVRQLDEHPFVDEPDIESHLRLAIGRTYGSLGLFPESHRQLELARTLGRTDSGMESESSLQAWTELIGLFRKWGKTEEAERHVEECLTAVRATLGERHFLMAQLLTARAANLRERGEYPEAERIIREAIQIGQLVNAPPEEQATFMNELSLTVDLMGRIQEAIELQEAAIAILERTVGPSHASTTICQSNLAGYLTRTGEFDRAEQLYRQCIDRFREAGGMRSLQAGSALDSLGRLYARRRDFPRAAECHQESLAIRRAGLPASHVLIAHSLNNLALCQYELGDVAAALDGFEGALALFVAEYGEDHPLIASFLNNIASVAWASGDFELAASHLRRALEIHEGDTPPDPRKIATARHNLGNVLEDQHQFEDAERLFRESLEARISIFGVQHVDSASTMSSLSRVLRRQGKLDEAEPVARDALRIRQELFGNETMEVAESLGSLAQILVDRGNPDEALSLMDQAMQIALATLPATHWRIGQLHTNRARVLVALDRFDEAQEALEVAQDIIVTAFGDDNDRAAAIRQQLESLSQQREHALTK